MTEDCGDLEQQINSFTSWFEREIQLISETNFSRREEVYKRLLFCCLIDTITRAIVFSDGRKPGSQRGNKDKFLEAIRRYGNWPTYNKVSHPYLYARLSETKDSKFDKVKEYMANWPNETIVETSCDLDLQRLETIWPRESGGELLKIKKKYRLQDFTHDRLFYDFRNKLVHEIKTEILELEIEPDRQYPFYIKRIDQTIQPYKEDWILVHPPKFVENLASDILNGLSNDCRRYKINPWQQLIAEF